MVKNQTATAYKVFRVSGGKLYPCSFMGGSVMGGKPYSGIHWNEAPFGGFLVFGSLDDAERLISYMSGKFCIYEVACAGAKSLPRGALTEDSLWDNYGEGERRTLQELANALWEADPYAVPCEDLGDWPKGTLAYKKVKLIRRVP